MLDLIVQLLGFLLGVHLTITLLGSLYRIIDLRFCLGEFWLEITARICLNLAIIFLIYFWLSSAFIHGFVAGQIFFLVFHLAIYWIGQLLVIAIRKP